MELLKLLSASEIVAQTIAFLFLFFVLRKFFWSRLIKLLDERKALIASQFQQMEDSRAEVERMKRDYADQMSSIRQKADQQISQAVMEGRKLTDEIKAKAQRDAEAILSAARVAIGYEVARAKEALKEKVVDLTLKATEKVIEEKMTSEHDRNLVKGLLKEMDEPGFFGPDSRT